MVRGPSITERQASVERAAAGDTRDRVESLSTFGREVMLVGGGRMGTALLAGWLRAGLPPALVRVIDPFPSAALIQFTASHGLSLAPNPSGARSGVVVLAVKPQSIEPVALGLAGRMGEGCLVLSIMAGVRIARLRELFPAAASIHRAMPNLPASVGCGATLLVSELGTGVSDDEVARRLLAVSGLVERLAEENLLDVGTALSGSGPGYLFYLVECLAAAGSRAGLPPDVAARLARRTVEGAGALLSSSSKDAGELRVEVTSPGGTTQAGLAVLANEDRLASLLTETLQAAAARSRELGS